MKLIDLTGQTFGHLTVIKKLDHRKGGRTWWLTKCACGNEREVNGSLLKISPNISCGCQDFCCTLPGKRTHRNPQDVTINAVIGSYKTRCKKMGLDWQLDREQAKDLFQRPCYYCGTEPHTVKNAYKKHIQSRQSDLSKQRCRDAAIKLNGIDRIDSTKGYFVDNCVTCCSVCNFAKRDLTIDDFFAWIDRLIKHRMK